MLANATGLTHVGRVRKRNEDTLLIDDSLGLYVVADGMGGHAGGDVASKEAVEQVQGMVARSKDVLQAYLTERTEDNRAAVRRSLEAAIQAATYMVHAIAQFDPERKGMGTTISCLLQVGDTAFVGQVGDSRVYLVRQGRPFQITEDHTLVNARLKKGSITKEQAKKAPYQNLITRAVGVKDYVHADIFDVECISGDRFVLCSDGVHGYFEDEEDLAQLLNNEDLSICARAIIDNALDRGGRDNATVLLVGLNAVPL